VLLIISLLAVSYTSNGNYVVASRYWDNVIITDVGAATWGNGITGSAGRVGAHNSLVGSSAGDYVSFYSGITALANGNYVVGSNYWKNGTVNNADGNFGQWRDRNQRCNQ
jgi:hypothetical protein